MKYFSTLAILALYLGSMPLNAAQTMMKYSEINQIGDPAEVVELKEHSSQPLKSGEVRVRVLAAPINPSNLLQIAGKYGTDAVLPSTPGSEGVGRVLETSAEVKHLAVGQLVLMAGAGGTWRDEMVAPAAGFIPLPELGPIGSDVIEQLSMSVVNPITALLMLTTFVDVKEGQWIVQSASNSAVGGYVIQLAKQRGIKTINVVRREGLAEELMAKGADVVLIDGPDLAAQIASAANNEPVVLALDAVGGDTYTRLANSLGQGGTLVAYGMLSGKPAMLNTGMTIFKDLRTRGFWLSKWYETAERKDQQAAFGQIIPLIAQGILKADIDSRFTVAEIKQAVTRAGQRGRNGKVLIVPKVD
ncbi:MAG: trans-2-enoyl-CoA reductase [Candidatus Azotimanducaceae bacterium]|jgi:trans-2-enoyl-CoA reductase